MNPWWIPVLLASATVPWVLRRTPSRPGPATGRRASGSRSAQPAWPERSAVRRRAAGSLLGRFRPEPAASVRIDAAVLADIMAAALAAGAAIPSALMAMGRAVPGDQGQELLRVAAVLRLGGNWESAWEQSGADLQVLARALAPAWSDGVAPGALLAQVAERIRAERAAAARDAAARLGVRLVLPMGLCWLPAFVLLGLVPVLLSAGGSLWP